MRLNLLQKSKAEQDRLRDEDSCDYSDVHGVFAIADGAGSSSYAAQWSTSLVEMSVVDPLYSADPAELSGWLKRARSRFLDSVPVIDTSVLSPHQRELLRRGAFSTFLQVRFEKLQTGKLRATCLAVGDSCAFLVKKTEEALRMFPALKGHSFDRPPALLGSSSDLFNPVRTLVQSSVWELGVGDRLVLATDAVARWLADHPEPKGMVEEILTMDSSFWAQRIDDLRRSGSIGNDDSTVLAMEIEEADLADGSPLCSAISEPAAEAQRGDERPAPDEADSVAIAEQWGDPAVRRLSEEDIPWLIRHREVFMAVHEMRFWIGAYFADRASLSAVESAWAQHRIVLDRAVSATAIRRTLDELGVAARE
jgi:hypothetical protein